MTMRIIFEADTEEELLMIQKHFSNASEEKSANAIRCKRYRDNKKTCQNMSNDTTEEERKEEEVSPLDSPLPLLPPNTPIIPITPLIPSSQEEKREEGNNKKSGRGELKPFGEFVRLSDTEYLRLVQDFGQERVERMIESMNNYIGEDETGKLARKYKTRNHNLTLRNWENRRAEERRQPTAKITNIPKRKESWIEVAERLAKEAGI